MVNSIQIISSSKQNILDDAWRWFLSSAKPAIYILKTRDFPPLLLNRFGKNYSLLKKNHATIWAYQKIFYSGSTLFSQIVLKNHFKRKPLAKPITVQIDRNDRLFIDYMKPIEFVNYSEKHSVT